jgi:dsDNA-specific endonuclease/ATPase MutS2
MTSTEVKNFRNDFENAVKELQNKYGVNISIGAIRYSDSELRFKVTARKGKVAPKLTKEAFQVGDKVKINHKSANGKEWLIEKIMTKNIRVSEIGGIGMVRVSPSLLEKL